MLRETVRGLTVRQPYAWAIAAGVKRIENRSWAPTLKGDVLLAIHAGAAKPRKDDLEHVHRQLRLAKFNLNPGSSFDLGAIIGVARLVDVRKRKRDFGSDDQRWFEGPIGWLLADAQLIEPIPCKGQLGLWSLKPAVLSALEERLARADGLRPKAS